LSNAPDLVQEIYYNVFILKKGWLKFMDIFELSHKWQNEVDNRNPYVFGEEPIDTVKFAELYRETFEVIKKHKNDLINGVLPEDKLEIFDYTRLLCALSQYTMYDCLEDESEHKLFTVTCEIAQELVHYANSFEIFEYTENGRICSDYEETQKGILRFPLIEGVKDDIDTEDGFIYDIYKGDFKDIIEYVFFNS